MRAIFQSSFRVRFAQFSADQRGVMEGDNTIVFGTLAVALSGASWFGTEIGGTLGRAYEDMIDAALARISR